MYVNFFSRRSAVAVAISILTAMSGTAYAGEATETATTIVQYADLDLSSKAGVDNLYKRLHKASIEVCNVRSLRETGSLRASRASKACYDAAMKTAMDKLSSGVFAAEPCRSDRREHSTS